MHRSVWPDLAEFESIPAVEGIYEAAVDRSFRFHGGVRFAAVMGCYFLSFGTGLVCTAPAGTFEGVR